MTRKNIDVETLHSVRGAIGTRTPPVVGQASGVKPAQLGVSGQEIGFRYGQWFSLL